MRRCTLPLSRASIASGSGYLTYAVDPFVADEIESLPVPEFTRPPGYPGFLSVMIRMGFPDVAAGIGLSIAWLTVPMLAFYRLASAILGSRRGALFLCGWPSQAGPPSLRDSVAQRQHDNHDADRSARVTVDNRPLRRADGGAPPERPGRVQ